MAIGARWRGTLALVSVLVLGGCPADEDDNPTDTGVADTSGDTSADQGGPDTGGDDVSEDSAGGDVATDSGGEDTGGEDTGGEDTGGEDTGSEDATADAGDDTGEGDAGEDSGGDAGDVALDFDLGDVADAADAGEDSGPGPLPTCEIDFDRTCPDDATECGADFSGGPGCRVAGLGNCYESGSRSYEVTTAGDLTITFAGDVNALDFFIAFQDSGHDGSMTFFDADGNQVGTPVEPPGPCNGATMHTNTELTFDTPVRSAVVTATTGTLWIDSMLINP